MLFLPYNTAPGWLFSPLAQLLLSVIKPIVTAIGVLKLLTGDVEGAARNLAATVLGLADILLSVVSLLTRPLATVVCQAGNRFTLFPPYRSSELHADFALVMSAAKTALRT